MEFLETAVCLESGGIHSTYDRNFNLELLVWRWKGGEEEGIWGIGLSFYPGALGGRIAWPR